jgi:glycosyltransferase involved in cell wall biosynthesis
MKKVCILLSVQHPFEVRVFRREARTLAKNGYHVTIVARCQKSEKVEGIKILGVGEAKNRLSRILGTWRVFIQAVREKADIYQVLNPELLLWGVILRIVTRKPVVYDVHEHFPDSIKIKPYISPLLRRPFSLLVDIYERILARFVSYVITADSETTKRFRGINKNVSTLFNFPAVEDFKKIAEGGKKKGKVIIYPGSIGKERGGDAMLQALELVKRRIPEVKLMLIGFSTEQYKAHLKDKIERSGLDDNILMLGPLAHQEVIKHIKRANVGLSLLQPSPKFEKNIPQKVFEYMACGIPVVSSDLTPIRAFLETSNCGILVDPTNPEQVADALIFFLEHPEEAEKMGQNGRQAVWEKYNWENESQKLLALYKDLLKEKRKKP